MKKEELIAKIEGIDKAIRELNDPEKTENGIHG